MYLKESSNQTPFLAHQIELANKVPNFQKTLWEIISFINFSNIVQVYYLAEYSRCSLVEVGGSPPPPFILIFLITPRNHSSSSSLDCTKWLHYGWEKSLFRELKNVMVNKRSLNRESSWNFVSDKVSLF